MSVEAHIERASSLSQIGRHTDAVTEATSAIRFEPHNARAHMSLAHASLMAGAHTEAIRAASAAAAIEPEWEWPHRLMAVAYRGQGEKFRKQERAAAEQSVKLGPLYAVSHATLAEALRHDRRTRKRALTEAKIAVELDPEDDTAHLTLGNVHLSMKDREHAEIAYRTSLSINPESTVARKNLATVLRLQGRPEDALPIIRSNILDNPTDRRNMVDMAATATEFIKGGPISKLMLQMFRLAYLRLPIVIALILWPFAKFEQRRREEQLPAEVRAARIHVKATAKTDRTVSAKGFIVFACVVILIIGVHFVVNGGWFAEPGPGPGT